MGLGRFSSPFLYFIFSVIFWNTNLCIDSLKSLYHIVLSEPMKRITIHSWRICQICLLYHWFFFSLVWQNVFKLYLPMKELILAILDVGSKDWPSLRITVGHWDSHSFLMLKGRLIPARFSFWSISNRIATNVKFDLMI